MSGDLRIVVCSVTQYGHVEKMRVIAADLVRRGYKVSFLTGSKFQSLVEPTGVTFIPLHGKADMPSLDMDVFYPERQTHPPGLKRLVYDLRELFIGPIPDQFTTLQALVARASECSERVVFIQDTLFMGAWPFKLSTLADKLAGIITIGIHPLMCTSIDTAPVNMCIPPDSSPEGRARNVALNNQFESMLADSQQLLVDTIASVGGKLTTNDWMLDLTVRLPDRYLQACIESLEYTRSDQSSNLSYIGPHPTVSSLSDTLYQPV